MKYAIATQMLAVFIVVSLTLFFIRSNHLTATGYAIVEDIAEDSAMCQAASDCEEKEVCCTLDEKSFCTDVVQCKSLYYTLESANNQKMDNPLLFILSSILITGSVWYLIVKPLNQE
ncbi:MAG: hypothetical protein ABIH34_06170 [Nanoarchaeota archaeon]